MLTTSDLPELTGGLEDGAGRAAIPADLPVAHRKLGKIVWPWMSGGHAPGGYCALCQ